MTKNPILDELRHVREALLAKAGGTLDALVDRLQAEERRSDHSAWKPARDVRDVRGGTVPAPAPATRAGDEGAKQAAG